MVSNSGRCVSVALAADKNILSGLHVTLLSALDRLSEKYQFDIHLFSDSLDQNDLDSVRRTLDPVEKDYMLKLEHVDTGRLKSTFPSSGVARFSGWLPYARLFMPAVLEIDRFIYLDSDLVVGVDLANVLGHEMDGALGAVSWHKRSESMDSRFFDRIGEDAEVPYFNSGVLLIDRQRWLEDSATEECLELAAKHGSEMPSADQTLLNLVYGKNFLALPRRFNTPISAERRKLKPTDVENRVIHLLGKPKPWDPLGKYFNGQYSYFEEYFRRTSLVNSKASKGNRWKSVAMIARHLRAYRKCAQSLYFGG
ncbi:hypothetical protein DTL21_27550 [Bremerella cremea]|uniref:Glycosyltransferase family 8 protein n=1 Tax=Blastopirellula marina TaxID=124 RepID=A0A2S8FCC5_9BACT|nr:hypothetical protein C5Y83_27505 [Blastopirellula marina]RCS43094.1 hypothetical protein DTL21_27550 [Bremerella cremea]